MLVGGAPTMCPDHVLGFFFVPLIFSLRINQWSIFK